MVRRGENSNHMGLRRGVVALVKARLPRKVGRRTQITISKELWKPQSNLNQHPHSCSTASQASEPYRTTQELCPHHGVQGGTSRGWGQASFSVLGTQLPTPHLTQSKRHSSKDSSLSLNFHGNESIYLRTQGGEAEGWVMNSLSLMQMD